MRIRRVVVVLACAALAGCQVPRGLKRGNAFLDYGTLEKYPPKPPLAHERIPAVVTEQSALELARRGYIPVVVARYQTQTLSTDTRPLLPGVTRGSGGQFLQVEAVNKRDRAIAIKSFKGGKGTYYAPTGTGTAFTGTYYDPSRSTEYEVDVVQSTGQIWEYRPGQPSLAKEMFATWGRRTGKDPAPLLAAYQAVRMGYIDRSGRLAIPGRFESAGPFIHGVAQVYESGKKIYIDTRGRPVRGPASQAEPKVVEVKDEGSFGKRVRFVDANGKPVHEGRYQNPEPFHEGLAAVTIVDEKFHRTDAYIDTTGKVVIPLRGGPFYSGRALIKKSVPLKAGKTKLTYTVIDKTGRRLFEVPGYPPDGHYTEGVLRVRNDDDSLQYLDENGRQLFTVAEGGEIHDGRIRVTGPGGQAFADKTGARVIPGPFRWATSFSDGRACVMPAGSERFGFVDAAGKMIIPSTLPGPTQFADGLAPIAILPK